jgi:P-type Cu+ transporter
VTLKLSSPQNTLDNSALRLNGVTSVEQLASDLVRVQFNPEAVTARQVAYLLEDRLYCKTSVFHEATSKMSLVQQQQQYMRSWLKEFLLSLIFTVPIFVLSMIVGETVDNDNLTQDKAGTSSLPLYNLFLWLLATPVQFWFGMRFYRGAYKALLHRSANMDTLIALGTSAAYFYGAGINLSYVAGKGEPNGMRYMEAASSFETSSLLISIVLLGKYIESRSKHKTTDAITKLAKLQISHAVCVDGQVERETDVELLEVGCVVKVYPGASVPVDGHVIEGEAWINESMMTGESSLVKKTEGCFVFGGTVCNKGTINVTVTKVGKDTALAQIISLVESAQSTKPPIQAVADKISSIFVPAVITLACITWTIWFALIYGGNAMVNQVIDEGNHSRFIFGFNFGISVLVVACPCALGLATPTAVMVATGVAAKYGILIKGGEALEGAANIKTIVFDKTGTLTEGKPHVEYIKTYPKTLDEKQILAVILAVEAKSEHPIAKAICQHLKESAAKCIFFENIEGEGVIGEVEIDSIKHHVHIGNMKLMRNNQVQMDKKVKKKYTTYEEQGKTVIMASIGFEAAALIVVAESELVKPEAPWVVQKLHQMGLAVWLITGDNERAAMRVADYLSIPKAHVLANCYPGDKKLKVEQLQGLYSKSQKKASLTGLDNTQSAEVIESNKEFNGVMFVGDGINDSPSLAQADIGIAVGGTDIANEAASVVLLKTDLKDIITALDLSQKALRKIKWNFFWAFLYNVCGIPLAAGVLYVWTKVQITSVMAAAAMACSSTAVVLSSLMLNRYRPPTN